MTSKVGVGSTFELRVALAAEPAPAAATGVKGRIVLALRDGALRESLTAALRGRGYVVVPHADASAAAQRLQRDAAVADLVICDVDDLGAEVLVALQQEAGRRSLGVAALGGSGQMCSAVSAAFDAVVHKPLGPIRLFGEVDALLRPDSPNGAALQQVAREGVLRSPFRVLVVEDNVDNQRLAAHVFRKAGYEVSIAENGQVAVERLAQWSCDLVVMDVEMPVMDGLSAAAAIRAWEAESGEPRVPIVALTAHAMLGFRDRCLDAGMDDYATKPAHRDRLLLLATTWVDRRPVVLITDDAPDIRRVLRHYLLRDGRFRVVEAASGREALRVLDRQRVDVMLLDLEMPDLGGFAVAKAARELDPQHRVRIVALSGHGDAETRRVARESRIDEFLQKPASKVAVIDVLMRLFPEPLAESRG